MKFIVSVLLVTLSALAAGQRLNSNQDFNAIFNEATKNYLFGKYVQAVNLYKECLRINPLSSATNFQLSKVYLSAGNLELAREHAKRAVENEKENKWYLQSLGDIYQMEQKNDSAVIYYEKLLELDNDNVNIIFGIASLYEKLKNFNQALIYLERIDELVGKSREVAMSRYRIYEAANNPDKALRELKDASLLSPEDYSLKGMIAEFYQRHQNQDSASYYYQQLFPAYENDPNVVFSYAGFLLDVGKVDTAKELLVNVMNDKLIDHSAKTGYFYNVLRDEQNFKKAVTVIEPVTRAFIKGYENDIRSLSIFADVFLRLRKYNEASNALVKIADTDPQNYPVTEQLIYVLNILGKPDSVILYFQRAIKLPGAKPVVYLFAGSAYYQKKDYVSALKELNRGLVLTDDISLSLEFYSLLAECYQQTSNYEESERAFKKALEIDKDNLAVKNNFAYYLSLREKALKYARKISKSTIKAEPENPTYLDTYGWILFKMNKISAAKKYIKSALDKGSDDNEEVNSHYAEILIKSGEYAEAVKYLEKIIAMPDEMHAAKARERIKSLNSILKK